MRAAFYRRFGPAAEVLEVADIERPDPGPGEVLVRVVVSGVNPTDYKARRGSRPLRFPFVVPHQDGAGVIEAVGPEVDGARIGERVWVYFAAYNRQYGTAGEYTVVPARNAVVLPPAVSWDLGASLGVPALTAYHALFCDGPIEGDVILISGGAGAVGHCAIELARDGGASMIITTVSSPEKAALAEAAGADLVINYRTDDVRRQIQDSAPDGVSRIVDVALGSNIGINTDVLAPHGTVVSYAQDVEEPTLDVARHMFGNHTLRFMLLYEIGEQAVEEAVRGVTHALGRDALTSLPASRYDLDAIVTAHEACERGAIGKVLLDL